MKIPERFPDSELVCKCGCGLLPDMRFVERLYAMRLILDIPLVVLSGARCPDYNIIVGGSEYSYHGVGAADILARHGWTRADVIQAAIKVGMTGIGVNRGSIHVDDKHDRLTIWDYYKD